MRKIEKVTLIGLGAMGVFFAPKLAAYLGKDNFRVLAGGERRERLLRDGVTLNGVPHHFTVITPEEEGDPADLIIIAVKDTGLAQAIGDIRNQVGPDTQILSVLNGIDSEEKVAAVYGWEHVLYSFMRVSITMKDGTADFNPELGKVYFGEARNPVLTDRVKEIKELFEASKIAYSIEEDMIRGIWFKFMCNIGENLTCAMFGVPYGLFQVSEHANKIRHKAMWEVVAIANRLGIELGQEDIDHQEKGIKRLPVFNKPSTLQDLENGKRTEIEMFAGKVVQLGQELGIDTPLNWMFYHGIKIQEEKSQGKFSAFQPYTVQPIQPKDAEAFVQYMESVSFSHAPHWAECYCRFYHCPEEVWRLRTAGQNRDEALEAIREGSMQGYLAYNGERIIGWCNANDVHSYGLLAPELLPVVGEQKTGMVICFVIDQRYRNKGVARLLLDAAITGFRTKGYEAVLAMPVDTDATEKRYRGTWHMYQERGFLPEQHGDISLMRLALN